MRLFLNYKSIIIISTSLITVIILIKRKERQWILFVTKLHVLKKKITSFIVRRLNPNLLSWYCCLSFEILELSSRITSSPKSSSPQTFLRNLLRCNCPKSSSLLSFSSWWLSFNLCCGWVTFLVRLVYICSCGWVTSRQSPKT